MSALETFYFAFKSDAKDVIEGTKKARQSANQLEVGLLDTKQAAEALSKSFLGAVQSATRNVSALLTVSALTARTLRESAQAEDIGRFSERLNQNVEEVATWGKLLEHTGGTSSDFRGTLEGLTNTLTEFAITGGGAAAETFARLGINAFNANGQLKTAMQLLPDIADAFQELDAETATHLGQKLGLDNATILLLQRGRDEIETLTERQQRLGIITREDTELVTAFNMAWRDTRTAFDSLVRNIGFEFLPALTSSQETLQNFLIFLRENEDLVGDMFKAAAAVLTAIYLPAIGKAAVATLVAVSPFLLIGGTIALLGLAINDLVGYLNGYDSIIGRLLSTNEDAKASFDDFVASVRESFRYIQEELVGDALTATIDGLNKIRAAFGLEPVEGGTEPRAVHEPLTPEQLTHTDLPFLARQDEGGRFLHGLDNNPLASTPNPQALIDESSRQSYDTRVNISRVDVDARGNDAEGIADNMGTALEGAMENTIANMATAIRG